MTDTYEDCTEFKNYMNERIELLRKSIDDVNMKLDDVKERLARMEGQWILTQRVAIAVVGAVSVAIGYLFLH